MDDDFFASEYRAFDAVMKYMEEDLASSSTVRAISEGEIEAGTGLRDYAVVEALRSAVEQGYVEQVVRGQFVLSAMTLEVIASADERPAATFDLDRIGELATVSVPVATAAASVARTWLAERWKTERVRIQEEAETEREWIRSGQQDETRAD